MPLYEYRCTHCERVSRFVEKMFQRQRFFFGRRRCKYCGSRKLTKVLSQVSGHVKRTNTEMMNEMAAMGNVSFIPQEMMKRPEPPGGVCPYHNAAKAEEEKAAKEKAETKAREPIIVR